MPPRGPQFSSRGRSGGRQVRRAIVPRVARLACGVLVAFAILAAPARATMPHFGHVFLIVGENTSLEQFTPAHAPFLTSTVKPAGAWLTGYRSFRRSSSLGQYIAMVSGR